ncbi:MAG: LacI family transcriptional regulator [Oscillospiraceae bacterium]|nr:LacI family transcriptional regulator [Oscillospiraceae bacterium]MCL2277807.1 LacI family transcriptional regulator [Oscillospiraceae bacterium]
MGGGCNIANIIDVAKLAGVSKSTVSRVINNNGYVDTETRKAVTDAIAELNYTPSSFAQSIRTRKSKTIAMMVPDASNTFYTELFKVVEDVALEYDYMVIVCDTRLSYEYELMLADRLLKRHTDGLLYFTQQRTEENQEFFINLSKKIPVIFMDYAFADIPDISCVAVEGMQSTSAAVKFLFNKGKRNIAYVNLPGDKNVTMLRFEGYRQGLELCGLEYDPEMVVVRAELSDSLVNTGYCSAQALLNRNEQIDAIVAASDQLAVGVLKYLKHVGIKIPEQISVVGFDNLDLCTITEPTLTTIAQPIEEMGREATHLLLSKIYNSAVKNKKIIYNGMLIERQST